jgi:hypothetical protein
MQIYVISTRQGPQIVIIQKYDTITFLHFLIPNLIAFQQMDYEQRIIVCIYFVSTQVKKTTESPSSVRDTPFI